LALGVSRTKVKVVGHKRKAVNLPGSHLAGFSQGADKKPAIVLIAENRLLVVAAIHDAGPP
jgi:hypothetical protein